MAEDAAVAILDEFNALLEPLANGLGSTDDLSALLSELGWTSSSLNALDAALAELQAIDSAVAAVGAAVDAVVAAQAGDETSAGQLEKLLQAAVQAIQTFGQAIDALKTVSPSSFANLSPFDQQDFWAPAAGRGFPELLFDHLVSSYLERRLPTVYGFLIFIGILASEPRHPEGASRVPFIERTIHWERLPELVTPAKLFAEVYGWGGQFQHHSFLRNVSALLHSFGVQAPVLPPSSYADPYYLPGSVGRNFVGELDATVFRSVVDDGTDIGTLRLSVHALPIPPRGGSSDSPPGGLVLFPVAEGQFGAVVTLSEAVRLAFSGDFSSKLISVEIRPEGAAVKVDGASGSSLDAEARIQIDASPTTPWILLGTADGSHLELARAHIAVAAKTNLGALEFLLDAGADKLALAIDLGSGDGFIQNVLGAQPQRVDLEFGANWSSVRGFRFVGQTRIQVDLPVHSTLGDVLALDTVRVALRPGDVEAASSLAFEVSVTGGVTLGPVQATVNRVGVVLEVARRTDGKGTLGDIDLRFGFKPPTGIGLAIDAPAVSGGGFLELNYEAGRYLGVCELTLVDVASVKAIGIITTRLPDGSPGFALLLMITAEGFTPIPLGFGFELTGIGGLLALNRTVDADAVRGGLSDGVLDSILFIEDPVKNAARVVSTLDRVFPLAPDRLLIGPLAEISWGSPPIVKIRLALLLEIPQPVRAALLAALSALLPDEEDPVVELHVDAIGVLDLGRGELALDASLHHSRLLEFTLTGDMALRLNWGYAPTFLLSVGGFHPKFTPPAGLRPLNRVALTLTGSDNPRVRFETYLALTSNTIQMGARVTVYAEAAGFGVDGGGAFDALIQWSPFAVDVSFQAWVRIFGPTGTLLAAQLAVEVAGPQPWHVTGVAEFHFLFLSAKVPIDLTVGAAAVPPPVETVDVAALVWDQVGRRANWQAALPANAVPGVTLAATSTEVSDGQASTLPIHPFALLSLRQRVVPLGTSISRVGARLPRDGTRSYDLDVTAPTGVQVETLADLFAPGQYRDLPDDAKLSGPSFAPLPAGLSLRPEAANAAAQVGVIATNLTFETLEVTDLDARAIRGTPVAAVAASALAGMGTLPGDARQRAGWQVLSS
jgi:hypothetical protein